MPLPTTPHQPCHVEQEAGKSAGMLTLGVPPSVAQRGGFSAADALFDGCEWLGCWGMHGSCMRSRANAVHVTVHVCMPGALVGQLQ